jgi:outer membrane protein assembly factor BamA
MWRVRPLTAIVVATLAVAGAGCLQRFAPAARLERRDHVVIEGARGLDRDDIASALFIRGPGEEDIELRYVKQVYESRGYPEARFEVRRARDGMTRVVHVTEGRFARVARLTVDSDALAEVSAWPPALPLEAGGPVSGAALEVTQRAIAAGVRGAGCRGADVIHHVSLDPASRDAGVLDVRVSFFVAASACGERYRFGPVFVLARADATRKKIAAAVAPLVPPGEPFDMTKLAAVRQRVRDLGAFAAVRVYPIEPNDERRTVPIVIQLEEPPWRPGVRDLLEALRQ